MKAKLLINFRNSAITKFMFILSILFLLCFASGFALAGVVVPTHNTGGIPPRPNPVPPPIDLRPDLTIASITLNTNDLRVDKSFRIKVKVKNIKRVLPGMPHMVSKKSGPTAIFITLSNGTRYNFSVPALPAGRSIIYSKTCVIHRPMDLTITATVDPRNNISERNEQNNQKSITVKILGKPDFKIVRFWVDHKRVILPNYVMVHARIKNIGDDCPVATQMRFRFYGATPTTMAINESRTVPVPVLRQNAETDVHWQVQTSKVGDYIMDGMVDPNNYIDEFNENNNKPPRAIHIQVVAGKIDLDLKSAKPNHKRRHWYQKFVVTATVKNKGNRSCAPFNVHLYRLHDRPAGIAQGTKVDMVKQCPSLAPNGVCTVRFEFEYHVYVGNPRVEVKVDPEKRINDVFRGNNNRKLNLLVL